MINSHLYCSLHRTSVLFDGHEDMLFIELTFVIMMSNWANFFSSQKMFKFSKVGINVFLTLNVYFDCISLNILSKEMCNN